MRTMRIANTVSIAIVAVFAIWALAGLASGRMTVGGLGWALAPTGWPVFRQVFDALYTLFARHRVRMGGLFGRGCVNDRCSVPRSKPD